MKTVEEIERLTPEELDKMSADGSIEVPSGLEQGIENRILAFELSRSEEEFPGETAGHIASRERPGSRNRRLFAFIPAAAAAVAAVIVGLNFYSSSRTPADTFNSPEEAYAQVEKTFSLIGSKVGKGKSIADAAVPKMKRTAELLKRGE